MKHPIITIEREYGSGGREIAQNISERLELPVFDRKLIDMTADQCGYSTKFIQENEDLDVENVKDYAAKIKKERAKKYTSLRRKNG